PRKLKTMCPDMPWISHQRSSTGQKHRMIVNGSVNNQRLWIGLLLYQFGEFDAVRIEDTIAPKAKRNACYIESASKRHTQEKNRGRKFPPGSFAPKSRQ